MLLDGGDAKAAEAQALAALVLVPGWPPAAFVLGMALRAQGREDEAIDALRAALTGNPPHRAAHRPLARLLHRRAAVGEAIEHYRAAAGYDDRDADLWNELGVALTDAGELAAARAAYREALVRKPDYAPVESNLLVNLHYDPSIDAQAMFQAHLDWAARHAKGIAPKAWPDGVPSRPLRVGFLSPAFTAGPTATFLDPVATYLDRASFECFGYNVGRRDATSEGLRDRFAGWHELWDADDAAVAARVEADRLDVLVDLAGHTPGGRPLVLARKPAPRIASWLDYFDTTGLATVDALLADPVCVPKDGPQRFTERVIPVGPCRLCYAPPDHAPAVGPLPMARNGHATFGSFNRYSKLADPVLDAWTAAMRAVPGSRLVVKNNAFADAEMRARFAGRMAQRGIARERLDLRGPSPHAAMLAEYGDLDVSLDSFPYNGGLTTCESLWMGVPVVALEGNAMISRQSASLLAAGGCEAWIARDGNDYARIAADLVADAPRLAGIRAGLREALSASPLLDGPAFAHAFGAALLAIVEG